VGYPAAALTWTRRAMPRESHVEALRAGAASAGACLLSNPIDVVRTRLQLGSNGGVPQLLHTRGMASSLPAAMAYNVVLNSTRFALFHTLYSSEDAVLRERAVSSGLIAGGIAGFLASPLARLRTLQQAGGHTTVSAVRALAAAPFAGAMLWSLRNAGHTSCIFCLYQSSVHQLESTSSAPSSPSLRHLAASLFAASVSCLLMNPLDVLATRAFHVPPEAVSLHSNSGGVGSSGGSFGSYSSGNSSGSGGSSALIASEGPTRATRPSFFATAYRGLGANLLRTVPHTVLTFVFLEALRGKAIRGSVSTAVEEDPFPHARARRGLRDRASTGVLPTPLGRNGRLTA